MPNKPVPPPAPKKAPFTGILPSSPYYTENNNNISNENVENVVVVNTEKLVEETKKYPGNQPLPSFPSPLNFKPKIPKMKLPPHLQGGKTKRRKHRSTKTKRSKHTRKH